MYDLPLGPDAEETAEIEETEETEQSVSFYRRSLSIGPIPPASEMAEYEKACPGAANRLIAMAELEQVEAWKYRRTGRRIEAAGLVCGFILGMTGLGGGVWLAANGMSGVGFAAVIGSLATLAAVFVLRALRGQPVSGAGEEPHGPEPPTA